MGRARREEPGASRGRTGARFREWLPEDKLFLRRQPTRTASSPRGALCSMRFAGARGRHRLHRPRHRSSPHRRRLRGMWRAQRHASSSEQPSCPAQVSLPKLFPSRRSVAILQECHSEGQRGKGFPACFVSRHVLEFVQPPRLPRSVPMRDGGPYACLGFAEFVTSREGFLFLGAHSSPS